MALDPTRSTPSPRTTAAARPSRSGPGPTSSITKAPPTGTRPAGSDVPYVITVVNRGPSVARAVRVEDVSPPGLTLVNATAEPGELPDRRGRPRVLARDDPCSRQRPDRRPRAATTGWLGRAPSPTSRRPPRRRPTPTTPTTAAAAAAALALPRDALAASRPSSLTSTALRRRQPVPPGRPGALHWCASTNDERRPGPGGEPRRHDRRRPGHDGALGADAEPGRLPGGARDALPAGHDPAGRQRRP